MRQLTLIGRWNTIASVEFITKEYIMTTRNQNRQSNRSANKRHKARAKRYKSSLMDNLYQAMTSNQLKKREDYVSKEREPERKLS